MSYPATMERITLPSFPDAFPEFVDLTRPPPKAAFHGQKQKRAPTSTQPASIRQLVGVAARPSLYPMASSCHSAPELRPAQWSASHPSANASAAVNARVTGAGSVAASRSKFAPYPSPSSSSGRSQSYSSSSGASEYGSPVLDATTLAPSPNPSTPRSIDLWRSSVKTSAADSKPLPPHRLERARLKLQKRTCTVCDRVFDRPSTLAVHMSTHTGSKPFECELCGQKFTCSSNKYRHLRREESCVPALGTGVSLQIPSRLGQ